VKLEPREVEVINTLRAHPTAKITVSKFADEIRNIKTEIDADLAAKAKSGAVPRGTRPASEKISEPVKGGKTVGNAEEVRTQE